MSQVIKPGLSIQVLYNLVGVYVSTNKLFVTNTLYKKIVVIYYLPYIRKNNVYIP